MTTLVVQAHTALDQIPLGRRIEEIKKEKGNYYSTQAMAGRIGVHPETLRLMLKSKRDIYTFELEKIAADLKLPVERILQEDVREEAELLIGSLKLMSNPPESLEIAKRLSEKAIGLTERCYALKRLGKAYFNAFAYEESTKTLTAVHEMARKIHELYGETDALYSVMYYLMESFTAREDYETAAKILDEIRPFFVETPERCSAVSYQQAKFEESRGNNHAAKQFSIQSLRHAEETGIANLIAKTQLNLAHYEYLTFDYHRSRELLELAIEGLGEDAMSLLIARKELVKSLLKLGEVEQAITELQIAHAEAKEMNWLDMEGKLQTLWTIATGDSHFAESVFQETDHSLKVRYLACKCLQSHYKRIGDAEMYLHYHKEAEKLCFNISDYLDEGEL